jgi:hypothetical protein
MSSVYRSLVFEDSSMRVNQTVLAGLCGFLVGVAGTRVLMSSSGINREKDEEKTTADNRALRRRLDQLLEQRIASLEAELESLRAAPTTARLSASAEAAQDVPAKDAASSPPTHGAVKASPGRSMNSVIAAKLLGLEPGRQRYFVERYEQVLSKLQEAEKGHTTVSRTGGEVEIHISPFPDEGGILKQEWSGVLLSALSPQEQDRYRELQVDEILFPREMGVWNRYMVFQPEPDAVWPKLEKDNRYWPIFYERWTKSGETQVDPAARWAWSGPDAYRCYRHLLDPSDCKMREE